MVCGAESGLAMVLWRMVKMMRMTLRLEDRLTSLSTSGWYKLQLNSGGRGTGVWCVFDNSVKRERRG